jgi:putative DNA primase/helicase
VRQALKPIIAMAGELDVAIVGICHFRKGGGDGKSGDRLLGSVAYRNLPRSVLYVLKDPDNEAQRIVWHEKHNLSPQAPALSFMMQPRENSISIAWDADPVYIDDISRYLKAKSRRSTKADEAKAWLTAILPPGTTKPRDEIIAAARAAGFHEKTLYRAADGIAKDKATGLWHNNQEQEMENFRF